MKNLMTSVAVLSMFGTASFASGFEPFSDPVVTPPAVTEFSWSGPYIGISGRESRVRNTFSVTNTEVVPGEIITTVIPGKEAVLGKWSCEKTDLAKNKCIVSAEDFAILKGLPEYNENGAIDSWERGDGSVLVRFNNMEKAPRGGSYVISEAVPERTETIVGETSTRIFVETLTQTSTSRDFSGFAGYRHDVGTFLVGAEVSLSENFNSLEATLSIPVNRFLGYVSSGVAEFDGETGWVASAGVDYAITNSVFVGTKFSYSEVGSYEIKNIDLRVGVKF